METYGGLKVKRGNKRQNSVPQVNNNQSEFPSFAQASQPAAPSQPAFNPTPQQPTFNPVSQPQPAKPQPQYNAMQQYVQDQNLINRIEELEAENRELTEKCAMQKLRIQIIEQKMFEFYTKYSQLPNL